MVCPNVYCENYGRHIEGRNRDDDGRLTPRVTCPACAAVLVTEDEKPWGDIEDYLS